MKSILNKYFQKLKDLYKKYFLKLPITPVIYFFLEGVVTLESRLKRFALPSVYLRAWKLDMLRGRYEKSTTELFKKIIKPGMIIIDIGAHIGYFTRLFSYLTKSSGHVYAFEADPSNFALLKKNTLHSKNINIYQFAISDYEGNIDFFHSELKTGCHSTIPSSMRHTKLSVAATTLDEIVKKENINHVDIIKMDIEGGEVAALRGMLNTLATNTEMQLITEFNPECFVEANIKPLDFLQQLTESGFFIYAIRPSGQLDLINTNQSEAEIMQGMSFVNVYCSKKQL